MKKKLLALTVSGLLALAPVSLYADDMQSAMGKKGGPSADHVGKMGNMLQSMNLSDEQKTQVKSIIDESRDSMQSMREHIQETSKALRSIMKQPEVDLDQVKSLADKQGAMMSEMLVTQASLKNKIYNILTPEQQQQLLKIKDEVKKQMKDFSKEDGGPSLPDAPVPPAF